MLRVQTNRPSQCRRSTLNPELSTFNYFPVGSTGFEPAHPFGHKALNLARLPISPRARVRQNLANMPVYSPPAERQATARGGDWQPCRGLFKVGVPSAAGVDFRSQ